VDYLFGEMDAGRLKPGSRVNAAGVAQALGMSAGPVREALCVLVGRGLIEFLPDRGARMLEFDELDVRQLWEVLAPIAAVGLRRGAEAVADGAPTETIERAYEKIRAVDASMSNLHILLQLSSYHFAVNDLGGNPNINAAIRRLNLAYWERYLSEMIDVRGNLEKYRDNYRRIHDAVMAGDGSSAESALYFHADWSVALLGEAERRRAGRKDRPPPRREIRRPKV
jgi:DNA-binding GntR family transcriptional regulator